MNNVELRECADELETRALTVRTMQRTDLGDATALAMMSLAVVFRLAALRKERDVWRTTSVEGAELGVLFRGGHGEAIEAAKADVGAELALHGSAGVQRSGC